MKNFKRYTVTSALPYTNGPVHIGHLAGAYLPADIYVRYLRSKGCDVIFICGSDEHGAPITIRAKTEGISPKEIVDKYHKIIGDSFRDFGISFDIYHRTSSPTHIKTASDFFEKLYEKNKFIIEDTKQYYDEDMKQFLADRYITGTCSKCGYEKAYGDQCENCGSSLNPGDLINPRSALSGNSLSMKKTKHWQLPLDQYQDRLEKYITEKGRKWKHNVLGQCKSWLSQGLQARAVTRDLDWGVPVPVKGAKGKVLYVWFEAPIGYISATRELFESESPNYSQALKEEYYLNERKPASSAKNWEEHWKSSDTKLVHFIGKDNIVFHCLIFPAMLMAQDRGFILPDQVPANEFLNLEGGKISTSRNRAVWLDDYLKDFKDQQDTLRYVLTATMPENKDNDFTWKDFQARNNNELAAVLGNFINRAITLTHRYYKGCVPPVTELFDADKTVINELKVFPEKIGSLIENYRFREALAEYMNLARLGNKYLADTEPWKLAETNKDRVKTVINTALQIAGNIAVLGEPFLPFTSKKLFKIFNLNPLNWNHAGSSDIIKSGYFINKPVIIFEKIDDDKIEKQIEKLNKTYSEQKDIPQKPSTEKKAVGFEDFQKTDIRIATVISAEKMERTKKLLKLTINTGERHRTIVSAIADYYTSEEIIGKQVCVLVNLLPRKIQGVVSEGMILMTLDAEERPVFIKPESVVRNGSEVR